MGATPINQPRRPAQPFDKALPHNLEAERAILGAVMLDNAAMDRAARIVGANDFFLSQNFVIFSAMFDLYDTTTPIDPITLVEHLTQKERIDSAGGAAYISSLADGLPRVSNIEHYAKIVAEKASQRRLISQASMLRDSLAAGVCDTNFVQTLTREMDLESRGIRAAGLTSISFTELIGRTPKPRQWVIEPLLPVRGRGQIFASRGGGKTWVTMNIAICVACGIEDCLRWRVPTQRPVVYVDGEMDEEDLIERAQILSRMHELSSCPVELIARNMQTAEAPHINQPNGRRAIERFLRPGSLLILDNLTSLSPTKSAEKETEDWAAIQDWLLDLSADGISTIFVHHAGWNADHSRGTSTREDLLSFVLRLRTPSDYQPQDGLRTEVQLTKLRGKAPEPRMAIPFELSLYEEKWLMRDLNEQIKKQVIAMLKMSMKPSDIALDLGIHRRKVYHIKKDFESGTAHEI